MGNIKVLIVEDEQRLADILKMQLEESGYMADIAYDGYVGKQLDEKINIILSFSTLTCH